MRIRNLNPCADIGASAWWVEMDGCGLLMDAGTHPKLDGLEALPLYDLIDGEQVDAIAISHCHHDHVGSLPLAIRRHPTAHVLMTELSYALVDRVLHNSVNVMKNQRREMNILEYPLFTHEELEEISHLYQGFAYNREVEYASIPKSRGGRFSPTVEFLDAGHALGSAGLLVRGSKQSLFYTGDACFQDQTILKGARFHQPKADILIMETTRGNRAIQPGVTRATELERFMDDVEEMVKQGRCLLIPTFALGRTQEILAVLALMTRAGRLRRQPIYIGGLGRVFTQIYDQYAHRAYRNLPDLQLRNELDIKVMERGESEKMSLKGGQIFVLTAGMMTENTTAHALAARMIQDERHGIFFVGYADPHSPAGRLRAAEQGSTFHFSDPVGPLRRGCDLREYDLTAHANREELLDLVPKVSPHTVILTHGEGDSRSWFAEEIHKRHPKIRVLQPGPGEEVEV